MRSDVWILRLGAWVGLALIASPSLLSQPYGLPGPRQEVAAYLNMPQAPPAPAGDWMVELAFPNLTFVGPLCLVQAPRSNRLYVTEREGRIYSFQNDPGTASKTLVLDISAKTQGWDDCGLMSMAFHSEFGLAGARRRSPPR